MPTTKTPLYIDDLTGKDTQSSPDCFVRVVRFKRRDTREYKNRRPVVKVNEGKGKTNANPVGIQHNLAQSGAAAEELNAVVLDIGSDVIQCNVQKSKGAPSGSFTLVLAAGDINYHHAINPGDHIFIWMRRNRRPLVKGKEGVISDQEAHNHKDSGLKLYGVITGVRKHFRANASGRKILLYQVTGKDFGYFFEASIYYNQAAIGVANTSKFFEVTGLGTFGDARRPDEIIMSLLDMYFGSKYLQVLEKEGPKLQDDKGMAARGFSENKQMYVPGAVQNVFNIHQREFVALLDRRVGTEKYNTGAFRPKLLPMAGLKPVKIDVGSQYPVWAALQAYSNPTINEMFLDLKLGKDGNIYPTFVCRQIPFTSTRGANAFANSSMKDMMVTRFAELPRIKLPEKFIISEDLGRSDHEKFNFIELFGVFPGMEELVTVPAQMYQGNFALDVASVKRYGLRPLITKTDFHFPDSASIDNAMKAKPEGDPNIQTLVPKWINLLADWYLPAHTLETGTISTIGIEEPLSIGDNIEIVREKGVSELYHVEAYTHSYTVDMGNGNKSFRTSIDLSRGQRVDEYPIYTSGTLNEDDLHAIGFSDQEEAGMARPESASTANTTGISESEIPKDRKKVSQ